MGDVRSASGGVFAQIDQRRKLSAGAEVLLGDLVWTEADARAALAMEGGSNVFLGASARLKIDPLCRRLRRSTRAGRRRHGVRPG